MVCVCPFMLNGKITKCKMFSIDNEKKGLNLLLFSMSKIKENIQVSKVYVEQKLVWIVIEHMGL